MSDLPTRFPFGLALEQSHIERILAAWVGELGVVVHRGLEVTGFSQDDDGVDVALSDDTTLRADFLMGCDGGRSVVRKAAGIDFPGTDPTISNLIAEVQMAQEPELGLRRDAHGVRGLNRLEDGRTVGVLLTEPSVEHSGEPTLGDLSAALVAAYGPTLACIARGGSRASPTPLARQQRIDRDACCWPGTPPTSITRPAARA